ncbi:hypothetical protein K469DRAFT_750445 [Zopfia rhizophila CBS 207.26]|uniref:Uncharacterized protein n=1 Tax=Zopfia rhizophila CBS 207.26 TaxID=1314779 RepID=A0A6A6E5Z6_9PEZI|nr:hypothetical protein K469DRAFT_750445 [Zopfia rhizophila CBS 207.26]
MITINADVASRYVQALRTQARTGEAPPTDALPCPYRSNNGRIFQSSHQLFNHVKVEHVSILQVMDPESARTQVGEATVRLKGVVDQSSEATAGGGSTPDITGLSLLESKGRQSPSGKKGPSDSDLYARRGKAPGHPDIYNADSPAIYAEQLRSRPKDHQRFDLQQGAKGTQSPHRSAPEVSSEWSVEANRSQFSIIPETLFANRPSTQRGQAAQTSTGTQRQPGHVEIQRHDTHYPGLTLQPDSRPISQEQLASEVKSIYAQALIALHRRLLHEHHDFFLASQLPSASPSKEAPNRNKIDSLHRRQRYVPISTNGNHIEAFPDTGSQLDIISHAFSTQLDLKLNKAQTLTIRTPTGRKIRTLGTVELDIIFPGEKPKHRRKFHVLEKSVHKMILGKSFLETTQTLTKFAHRIKSRLVDLASRISRLHLLGSVTERVIGSINGMPATAVDDTGSDVMVISWKEAERLGLHITMDHSHRTILEFVDGEEVYTDGVALDVDWRFGYNTTGEAIKVDLQVVRDLTCNLILSSEILFQANTYNNSDFFIAGEREMPIHNEYASLCVITDRSGRKQTLDFLVKWLRSQPAETDVEDSELIVKAERVLDEEVARQLYEEERINGLPEDERDVAWAEEYELRRKWEQSHTTLNAVPPALRTSGQPYTPSSASSGDPSSPTSTGNGAYTPSPTSTKQACWKRYFPKTRKKINHEGACS